MTTPSAPGATLVPFDAELRALVRMAAVIAAGSEGEVRLAVAEAAHAVRRVWGEEVVLQSYLFAGFPRALNAAREWRRLVPDAPAADEGSELERVGEWAARGEATCAAVYGGMYEKLRANVRALHPALDSWMVVEGYGKVLSRPGLDLVRRELCILSACAAARQDRQLLSHLHGARNVGAPNELVDATLDALDGAIGADALDDARRLWARVKGGA
ncbi:MAG: carboxymuconolactone decarboxylase family protein [Gemmatimonadaceae bacterium]